MDIDTAVWVLGIALGTGAMCVAFGLTTYLKTESPAREFIRLGGVAVFAVASVASTAASGGDVGSAVVAVLLIATSAVPFALKGR
ncbi:MAG: hypothetical protein HY875_17340 [Chloroflexi bacterium]|nr:hypothetical protein [Chloroflexota bacterium]